MSQVVLAFGTDTPISNTDSRTVLRAATFTNSLGMAFTRVSSPSNILICVWETRNQDYEVFAKNSNRSLPNAPFEAAGTYPVVKVSWDDALEFCAWLTQRERAAGLIGTNALYRLPTDLEWGRAMGLQSERGSSPAARFFYGGPSLPWGEIWPPPAGIGNLGVGLNIDQWKYTSPVGSFRANRLGIFDMVGNVSEWCADYYAPDTNDRVFRGSSFGSSTRAECAASVRGRSKQSNRMPDVGFRIVLCEGRQADQGK